MKGFLTLIPRTEKLPGIVPIRIRNEKIDLTKIIAVIFLFCIALTAAASSQDISNTTTFATLMSFNGTDGVFPERAALIQGFDGNFYGVAYDGGTSTACGIYGCGTVFKVTSAGKLTTLHSFDSTDGAYPVGTLVQGSNGDLYGTTYGGSAGGKCTGVIGGCGTVFKVTTGGTRTTLHKFGGTDGNGPTGLVQGTDGDFYGTTNFGGTYGGGTVFKITSGGTLTTLYSFCTSSGCTQNAYPLAALVQGTDGDFYGTTGGVVSSGCPLSCGTFFKITSSGTLTTLHTFDTTDGAIPHSVVQGSDGDFYGMTVDGGSSTFCANGCGTVFKVTSAGTLTTIYSFCPKSGCSDGSYPDSALVQGSDGKLYGTSSFGGAHKYGTAFKITTGGTLTTLHSFDSTDGSYPSAGLMQATSGEFYGTTLDGGYYGDGEIFSLDEGLAAFVETNPTSGKVKASVTILGTDLTGASSVTFNGTSATYTVKSSSEITTTVPTGATTGTVKVKTSSGTIDSIVEFTVTK